MVLPTKDQFRARMADSLSRGVKTTDAIASSVDASFHPSSPAGTQRQASYNYTAKQKQAVPATPRAAPKNVGTAPPKAGAQPSARIPKPKTAPVL